MKLINEVAVLQAGASVLIAYSIGHRNMISGLYWGYINTLVICECNGAENSWCNKLSLIDRVLACPGPSVVPGEGGSLHMFLFKRVKEIHPCHALRHIWGIFCCWAWIEGNITVAWKCMIHPRR
jgi:hypothetical protein